MENLENFRKKLRKFFSKINQHRYTKVVETLIA
jgi:hypothetical protein